MKYETAPHTCCFLEPRLHGALQNTLASTIETWLFLKFLKPRAPEGMSSPLLNKIKLQQTEPTF